MCDFNNDAGGDGKQSVYYNNDGFIANSLLIAATVYSS